MKKVALWTASVLAGLIALAYLGVLFFFPADRLREYIESEASQRLGQPVRIGTLTASFWGGLGVTLGAVSAGEGATRLTSIESVDVKMRFWPLLSGEYVVDHLVISRPELSIFVDSSGVSNLSLPASGEAPGAPVAPGAGEAALLISGLSFGELRIEDGSLTRLDETEDVDFRLWNIDFEGNLSPTDGGSLVSAGSLSFDSARYAQLTVSDAGRGDAGRLGADATLLPALALSYRASFDQQAGRLNFDTLKLNAGDDATVFVSGTLGDLYQSPSARLSYRIDNAALEEFLPLVESFAGDLPDAARDASGALTVSGGLTASGELAYSQNTGMTYDGSGTVTELRLPARRGIPELQAQTVHFKLDNNTLEVQSDNITGSGSNLSLDAAVKDFENPQVSVELDGEIALALLTGYLPRAGEPRITGSAQTNLNIEYRQSAPDKTQITGAVTISGGSLRATTLPEDITDISAQIKITPAEINLEKLHVAFESSDFTLSGVISDPFPYLLYLDSTDEDAPSPFLSFTGHSSRLDIDRLFPEAAPGSAVNRGALPATEAPPLPLPLVKGSGRVTFDTLVYSEAELTNVTADVRIHRDIIYCQDVRGDVYGGSFTGETTIDLREFENPHYTGRFDAANLLAGPAVSHFSPWDGGGSLLGRIKLSGDYDSYGWKPEDFLGSLSMNLLSSGDSLELKGFSFLAPLGVSFAEMTGMTTFKKQLATLDLRSFSSRLQFVDGKIMLNRLTGSSPKLGGWDLSGAVGLDGALDLKCAYAPSDEILPTLFRSKGLDPKYSDLLINPKTGRVELPLLIGGAFAKPTISIDEKKIGDIVGAALKKSAGDFLKDLFKQ